MTEQDDITDMKKCRTGRRWMAGLLLGLGILLAGCGDRQSTAEDIATPEDTQTDRIVVGFSQVGAESDWRSANTESMKSTFTKEAGYDLIFEDGQQKQANQIRAIRTFIQQEVDYIVLAPVTETGWDTVLREAKDAGIPVVIVDRKVDVEDDSLFTCFVGSDFGRPENVGVAEFLFHQQGNCTGGSSYCKYSGKYWSFRPDRTYQRIGAGCGKIRLGSARPGIGRIYPGQGEGSHGSFPEKIRQYQCGLLRKRQ